MDRLSALGANTWHHVQWYVERVSSTQYRYDTLVVDGQATDLTRSGRINATSWPDMIGIQYQLDQAHRRSGS